MDKDYSVSAKNIKRDDLIYKDAVHLDLKRKAPAILRELRGQGYPAVVVQVIRTPAQGLANLLKGTSKTGLKSKHIPTANRSGKCEAIDIAFENEKGNITWDVPAEWWMKLGAAYEAHGMVWGGRWKRLRDYNHGELKS